MNATQGSVGPGDQADRRWKALVGRVTLFPFPTAPTASGLPGALQLFKEVWKKEPDTFQGGANVLRPQIAFGRADNVIVGCSVQPVRVDFNVTPPPPSTPEDNSLPLISDTASFSEEIQRIIRFISKKGVIESVSRVGLVLHFGRVASSIGEANQLLLNTIPKQYSLAITDEEDFVLQINRPAKKTVFDTLEVKTNYITRWSVDRFQVQNVLIAPGSPIVDVRDIPSQVVEVKVASVVFDTNNSPLAVSLNSSKQGVLLNQYFMDARITMSNTGVYAEGF